MITQAYKDYIASEKWKIKRQQYFAAKGKYCRACRSTNPNMALHHLSYDRLGAEPLADLVALCHPCHREVHRLHRMAGRRTDIRIITATYIRQKTLQRLGRKTPRR